MNQMNYSLINGRWYSVKNFHGERVKAQYIYDEEENVDYFAADNNERLPVYEQIGDNNSYRVIDTAVELMDYYYSEQSAEHFHQLNKNNVFDETMFINTIYGTPYTEAVKHGDAPTCNVTDAVLIATEMRDVGTKHTIRPW